MRYRLVTHGRIKRYAGQCSAKLETFKSIRLCRRFAYVHDMPANTFSRMIRMHKKSPYPGGIVVWIKQWVFRIFVLVTAVQRLSFAPPPAACDHAVNLSDIIGAVYNQLRIYTKNVFYGTFNLRGR